MVWTLLLQLFSYCYLTSLMSMRQSYIAHTFFEKYYFFNWTLPHLLSWLVLPLSSLQCIQAFKPWILCFGTFRTFSAYLLDRVKKLNSRH